MRRLAPIVGLLLLATTVAPARAWADEPEKKTETESAPLETQYPPFSSRFKVLTAGLLVAGAAWGVSFAASKGWPENQCHITVAGSFDAHNQPCVSGPPGSAQLGIPIVGPWIALGKSGCASDEPGCAGARVGVRGAAFVLDGIVQAAGLGLIIQAIVMKTAPLETTKQTAAFTLHYGGVDLKPLPIVTQSMSGLGLTGTF